MSEVWYTRECIVLFAAPYSMTEHGRTNEGVSVWYYDGVNLDPCYDEKTGIHGKKPARGALQYSERINIRAVPGIYEMGFTGKTNKENKIEIVPVTAKFVSDLSGEMPTAPINDATNPTNAKQSDKDENKSKQSA